MLTVFGACVVTFMMLMYAPEGRGRGFVLGCALSSTYGFLAGTWPFGIVEGVWSVVALGRYLDHRTDLSVELRSADSSARSALLRAGSSVPIECHRSEIS